MAGRREHSVLRIKPHIGHKMLMGVQLLLFLPIVEIPDPDGFVV